MASLMYILKLNTLFNMFICLSHYQHSGHGAPEHLVSSVQASAPHQALHCEHREGGSTLTTALTWSGVTVPHFFTMPSMCPILITLTTATVRGLITRPLVLRACAGKAIWRLWARKMSRLSTKRTGRGRGNHTPHGLAAFLREVRRSYEIDFSS